MGTDRAVRIPRGAAAAAGPQSPPDAAGRSLRENRGGSRRAARVAVTYAGSIAALTAILAGYAAAAPEASGPGVAAGVELFLAVAVVLAALSAVYALTPAPRRLEVGADAVVVVGRWGRRRTWGPRAQLRVEVVRRIPPGFFSPGPVEVVRLADRLGRSATYELEAGLLDGPG